MAEASDMFDSVVVGAGITGAWIARKLADRGERVAVLEARQMPGGTSSYGSSLALLGTPEPYAHLSARVGDAAAREIWELTRESLGLLSQVLTDLGLPHDKVGSFRLSDTTPGAEELQRSADELVAEGFSVDLEDATDYGYLVGLMTHEDVAFEPMLLIHALLAHPSITVACEAQVNAVKEGASGKVSIWGHKHFLRAGRVILTNGAHAIHLSPALSAFLHPRYTHTIELEAHQRLERPLIVDEGRVGVLQHERNWRFAGCAEREPEVLDRLVAVGNLFCPQAVVRSRSSHWVAQSDDGLPVVGGVPDLPRTYVVGGLGVWGFSWVGIAVEKLAEMLWGGVPAGLLDIGRFVPA